jgi:hypothetical protein
MASKLAIVQPDGSLQDGTLASKAIQDRIRQAREHRKQFEPTWQSNLAYAAGKHWLVFDYNTRTLRRIQDVDPKYQGRELYSADIITEYRTTVLGELGSDDDRPELLLQHDDKASEDFQKQTNRAVAWGWDFQWDGDTVLAETDRMTLDLGTSAIQVYFDKYGGPVREEEIPHYDGQPVLDPEKAHELMGNGPNPDVQMQSIHEGKICWRPLSAFNLLVPPGVVHEKYFPWECVVRPTLLSDVQDEFGDVAGGLKEDKDIATTMGQSTSGSSNDGAAHAIESRSSRLRDHVWLFTYYERPSRKFQEGRVMVFAGNELKLIHTEPRLPYVGPDGTYRSGIAYFHWWRATGRFWSRALVESLKDAQRAMNKRRTQANEIIDRGMPAVFVEENSNALKRKGLPLELVQLKPSERPPVVVQGVGPGPWMSEEYRQIRDDAEHASGVRSPALGENPTNVNTYSQLALLREADQVKREPTLNDRKASIRRLVEDSVYDIRLYWGHDKQIMLAGDNDQVQAYEFNATKIPPFFIVKAAKGTAKPRSQAAELKKIEDIWTASLNSQQPLPVQWLKDSLEAGQALDLPEKPSDDQLEKAQRENHRLLQGEQLEPAYYDPPEVHIPIHRGAQIQADQSGDIQAVQTIEAHIKLHEQMAAENAAQLTQQIPGVPGAPPQVDPNQQAQLDQKDVHHQEQMQLKTAQAAAQLLQQQQAQSQQQPGGP